MSRAKQFYTSELGIALVVSCVVLHFWPSLFNLFVCTVLVVDRLIQR